MNFSLRSVLLSILLMLIFSVEPAAQSRRVAIEGVVKEADGGEPVVNAAVQLIALPDSSIAVSGISGQDGKYRLTVREGDYLLKISSLGYVSRSREIHVTPADGTLDFGDDLLDTDAIALKTATVTEKAPPMSVVADTLVYNPSAFIVDDDADLAQLLDRIPGIEVDGRGGVMLNGRPVRELLVNGKRFFSGDVKAGLKNIQARMLEKIKAYERPSDFARITGIDDGEEEPVLDLVVKPSFMKGWNNELRAAGGTGINPEGDLSGRYRGHFDANRITKETHTSVVANASNINSTSSNVSGRNQTGSGSFGDGHHGDAGFSYASKKPGNVMNGSLSYNWNSRWQDGRTRAENISATSHYNTDQLAQSKAFNNDLNAKFDYEWRPQKQFTIFFKPSLSYLDRGYLSLTRTSTYNSSEQLTNNTNNRSENSFRRVESTFLVLGTYRFPKKGRTVSAQIQARTFNHWDGMMYDLNTHYRKMHSKLDPSADSIKLTRSFLDTRLQVLDGAAQASWNEPIAKKMHLQATYRIAYKYYDNARSLYDFNRSSYNPEWSLPETYPQWTGPDRLPDSYTDAYYPMGSAYGTYHYIGQTLTLNYRYLGKKVNLTAGVTANNQITRLKWPEDGVVRDTSVVVWNFAPNLSLRHKHSKSTFLVLTYRSWAGQPNVDRMLPVANNTNPLYIRKGNPGLKPSFTHAANFSFNTSNLKKHFSLVLNAEARMIKNAVSSSSDYDPATGVRTVTPVNIDGTWSAKGSLVVNYTFPGTLLSLSSNTAAEYQNTPSYLYNSKLKDNELNITGRAMVRERATLSYRHKWFEALLNLRGEYTAERSSLRPELNQDPFTLSAGLSLTGRLPWKMTVTAEFTDWIQRGFLYDEFNRDYYLLNARIAQRFLKGNLMVSLIGNDLLGQMLNLNRSFSSERRAVSEYNGVNRYVLLQVVWRFKVN
ncbi:MAG: outer membrane beta-barrel protein [Bacteroidales bacterium]|nr:outer membrane beta-barrel protein [Bacteroidales bacterium]